MVGEEGEPEAEEGEEEEVEEGGDGGGGVPLPRPLGHVVPTSASLKRQGGQPLGGPLGKPEATPDAGHKRRRVTAQGEEPTVTSGPSTVSCIAPGPEAAGGAECGGDSDDVVCVE